MVLERLASLSQEDEAHFIAFIDKLQQKSKILDRRIVRNMEIDTELLEIIFERLGAIAKKDATQFDTFVQRLSRESKTATRRILRDIDLDARDVTDALDRLIELSREETTQFDALVRQFSRRGRPEIAIALQALSFSNQDEHYESFVTLLESNGIPGSVADTSLLRAVESGHLKLPARLQAHFVGADGDNHYNAQHKLPIFRALFAFEIARGMSFIDKPYNGSFFMRGKRDVRSARRTGRSLAEQSATRRDLVGKYLEIVLPPELLQAYPRPHVCEIGAAWGAATAYLNAVLEPATYTIFEIDPDLARDLEQQYNLKAMPCDGESLNGIHDNAMDIIIAADVFFFVPPIKLASYMEEIKRALKPGGLVFFNIITADNFFSRNLDLILNRKDLIRSYAPIPVNLIMHIFEDYELIPFPEEDHKHAATAFRFRKPAEAAAGLSKGLEGSSDGPFPAS